MKPPTPFESWFRSLPAGGTFTFRHLRPLRAVRVAKSDSDRYFLDVIVPELVEEELRTRTDWTLPEP